MEKKQNKVQQENKKNQFNFKFTSENVEKNKSRNGVIIFQFEKPKIRTELTERILRETKSF
ncbi:MAG: hypothetical protein IPH62_19095 [Ignavibacteriae bacterium]|nr:hypothetical protein [Ignavibacteriota bacterium]